MSWTTRPISVTCSIEDAFQKGRLCPNRAVGRAFIGTALARTSMIAVVEDDALVRNGIASLLRASGFKTATFETGHAFLAREPSTEVDLLISDYRMPGMTGVELIKRLRLDGNPLPVIIITAHLQSGIAEAASAAGALGFLRKPFNNATLLEIIRQAIG